MSNSYYEFSKLYLKWFELTQEWTKREQYAPLNFYKSWGHETEYFDTWAGFQSNLHYKLRPRFLIENMGEQSTYAYILPLGYRHTLNQIRLKLT